MTDHDLRKHGLKITGPRLKILSILEQAESQHLTAEAVYQCLTEQGNDVGLATVYRVLTQFESAGLVKRHNFEGGRAVFELDEGKHHDHMVCLRCSDVIEFVDEMIEDRQKQVAEDHGFNMTEHSFTLYGLCRGCSSRQ